MGVPSDNREKRMVAMFDSLLSVTLSSAVEPIITQI